MNPGVIIEAGRRYRYWDRLPLGDRRRLDLPAVPLRPE